MKAEVIAIDGPAGAGKSTIAKAVAKELGFGYLDTGAMYRSVALLTKRAELSSSDGEKAAEIAAAMDLRFEASDPDQKVIVNGEDVSSEIRKSEFSDLASSISTHPGVRKELVARQKRMCEQGRLVMEGRDTTTVVCPAARLKIYLSASVEERARRRHKQMVDAGLDAPSVEEIQEQIASRDHRDTTRADSPLKIAEGAVQIDTDEMTIDEVVQAVLTAWNESEEV